MAAMYGLEPTQLVLLLLGEKKSGKSSAGNKILTRQAFKKKTTRSQMEKGTVFGIEVAVIDTPGWLTHTSTPQKVSQELCRALTLCGHSGPHAILLVLPGPSAFGQSEWRAMEAQLRLLQTPIWNRAMVLFTHGDKLGPYSIQEHIRHQAGTLRWLLDRCGNRYQVLTSHPSASLAQVAELFQKIQRMVAAVRFPREIQQLRPDVNPGGGQRLNASREDIELLALNGNPRQRERHTSEWRRDPRGLGTGPGGSPSALSIILLGRRKSGKSSVGNMILERAEFKVDSKTSQCSAGQAEISGRSVTVVDTPGWSLFGMADPEQVRREMHRSFSLCQPGSRVSFLLAVPIDSFSERDRAAVETNISVLSESVWSRTLVLFTYGNALRGGAVEKYIEKKGKPLRWLLDRCAHGHHVCDTNSGGRPQVHRLLEMLEKI
ncbi:GTPase IMAP family member 8-like [Menidia menidia]